MRKYLYLAYDTGCICAALIVALYLRHGLPLIQEGKPEDLYLLLLVTFVTALLILPLMRIHTNMWRFTSPSELADIAIAVALVVLICNSMLFLTSRLDMMPRSVPPMHWALAILGMGGSRMVIRRLLGPRGAKRQRMIKQHVLVVGANHTAELYLQFIKRISRHPIVVEGIIDSDPDLTDRLFQKHKVLGTPNDIPRLLEELHVHGIQITQIILANLLDELSESENYLLQELAQNGTIEIVQFAKHMGPQLQQEPVKKKADYYQTVGEIPMHSYEKPKGIYPYIKRLIDIVAGIALMIILLPLTLLATLIVALDVGFPILFWQQRPGKYGKPFRLYKFRTMKTAGRKLGEDRLTHKSGDIIRTSAVGKMLRRLRLDELPQLFHIIAGTMSFVGPRPLLPEDQPAEGELRLSVRPGVTGWAQIHGGDALSPQEKFVLDIWYIRHMSLLLDIRIVLRTLLAVVKGDKVHAHVIDSFHKGNAA